MAVDTRHGPSRLAPATIGSEIDFALVVSRIIASAQQDPEQLRHAVYELARVKLQRETWRQKPPMDLWEMRSLMISLENAIDRVEADASKHDALKALQLLDQVIAKELDRNRDVLDQPSQDVVIHQGSGGSQPRQPRFMAAAKQVHRGTGRGAAGVGPVLRTGLVVLMLVGGVLLLDRYFVVLTPKGPMATSAPIVTAPATPDIPKGHAPEVTPANARPPMAEATVLPSPATTLPLPKVYGVYAVNNGQLYELEAIPGRVPDPRVFMSTAIKNASRTVIPDGQISFIVFRRDVTQSAPERVTVRVIAQIARAMSFNSAGAATTTPINDQWSIRGTSFDFRVAPVAENPEMLVMRPDTADFVFPAGRYGVVIKGQAYDFVVAGPITEPAQCLERVEATNGAFYSECRK
jgi:hypothetical protein